MTKTFFRQNQNLVSVKDPSAGDSVERKFDMRYLVRALLKYNASDLHIKVGRPPLYRVNGKLIPSKMAELSRETAEEVIFSLLNEKQRLLLDQNKSIDFSFLV